MVMIQHIPEQITQEKRCHLLHILHLRKKTGELEETDTFAIIGATITENFGIKIPENTIDYFI